MTLGRCDTKQVETLTESVQDFGAYGEVCIKKWLKDTTVNHAKDLLAILGEYDGDYLPVFLAWTERLQAEPVPILTPDGTTRGKETTPPTPPGLARLISWCLNVEPGEIFSGGIAASAPAQARGKAGRISRPDGPRMESLDEF